MASRIGPWATLATWASSRTFSAAIRSSKVWETDRRRFMTTSVLTGPNRRVTGTADNNMQSPGAQFQSEHRTKRDHCKNQKGPFTLRANGKGASTKRDKLNERGRQLRRPYFTFHSAGGGALQILDVAGSLVG